MRYKDKVVLVTGAGGGIGRATAEEFARQGARVVIGDIKEDLLAESHQRIEAAGGMVRSRAGNVAKHDDVKTLFRYAVEEFGTVDVAVNNAGIGAALNAPTHLTDPDDWTRVIAVNQTGVYYCMREALKIMSKRGSGCVVNVASVAGMRALPHQIAYVASKHAVVGMTKTAALEYAKTGIRVNSICPVFTNSPMLENLFAFKEELRAGLVKTIPVGRYGENADVVRGILYLADPEASFITGQNLAIDGGMLA